MNQQAQVKKRPKISLRVKICVALIIVSLIPLTIALASAYFEGIAIQRYFVRTRFQSLSQWMADEINSSFSSEISEAQSLALAPTLLNEVARANESYKSKTHEEALSEIERVDAEWRSLPKVNDTIRKYLGNSASQYLQNILKLRSDKYAEMFVTDEMGALVGATGKTTDFYQADEDWWVKAFNRGNGRNVITGVEVDESTQFPAITVAVPVIDPASNTVTGVLAIKLKADHFFHPVNTFSLHEQGGYAGVMTPDGMLLASSAPTRTPRLPPNFWQPIAGRGNGWADVVDNKGEENIIAFATIDTSSLNGEAYLGGGKWYVFFYQPVREGYQLISAAFYRVLILGLALVGIASFLGFYATNWIVMPIRLLREEAQYIARGDLGRHVEVHTNDEIELLAEEINVMSEKLKETHANLEQKIEERTTELSEANKKLESQREVLLKVNKQLMKASTLKSQFLAEICDGLNNPVLNIVQLAEVVAQQKGQLDEAQRDYLDDILSNAKHLHQLISEVFTLAKATSGKIDLNLSEFSVSQVLHEVHETVRAVAAEKNIRFEFEIDDNADTLAADTNLFKHIIFNLYTNAIKYSKINGKVTVATHRADNVLEISVADRGIGIRPEDQERIFHEFEKVEEGQEPYFEGTGMGLALVQRFVEMHGGKIWVESEYGKGSKFIFSIPLGASKG